MEEKNQMVKLYVIEEQRIFNNIYKEVFSPLNSICLMGLTNNIHIGPQIPEIKKLDPDILFISVKKTGPGNRRRTKANSLELTQHRTGNQLYFL